MIKRFTMAAILLGVVSFQSVATAQSSDPSWLDSLRVQLMVDENCEVQFFLNIREREHTAGNTYSARVQCEDGRQFDATRTDPAIEFTIESCGQAVCEAESQDQQKS